MPDEPEPAGLLALMLLIDSRRAARTGPETDWGADRPTVRPANGLTPTPIVALHRAVAIAETEGPDAALDLVDRLRLDGYHLFHAVRADLLRRSGRLDEAARAYRNALELTENPAERRLLQRRRDELR